MHFDASATELETWLCDGQELALIDVREPGQIGEGHILFSVPVPYSVLELRLPKVVPNRSVRLVLCDAGDGVAVRAAGRAASMGYRNVFVLAGGVDAWAALGRTLFKGVNVPSKVFGELVEHAYDTPYLTAEDLSARKAAGERMVILDGRPAGEYRRMTIPGALNCPNGELALRVGSLAPDQEVPIVVNCAGRTRSIIGAQTLRELGLANPVYALKDGTQGWMLAGFDLATNNEPRTAPAETEIAQRREMVETRARASGVGPASPADVASWVAEAARTTFLLDIRTIEERMADPADVSSALSDAGVQHAPGGQLIQATDQWVGVRNARLVVMDGDDVRASVVATWLSRLGFEVHVLTGGVGALAEAGISGAAPEPSLPVLQTVAVQDVEGHLQGGSVLLDLRSSADFREGHVPGATWAVRPRLGDECAGRNCLLVADKVEVAQLAAMDLVEAGAASVRVVDGGMEAWRAAGLPVEASADLPSDDDRIDFLFFVHDRHEGNLDASRAYLAWETGLIAQLDPRELAQFKV